MKSALIFNKKEVTTLQREIDKVPGIDEIKTALKIGFEDLFNTKMMHLFDFF